LTNKTEITLREFFPVQTVDQIMEIMTSRVLPQMEQVLPNITHCPVQGAGAAVEDWSTLAADINASLVAQFPECTHRVLSMASIPAKSVEHSATLPLLGALVSNRWQWVPGGTSMRVANCTLRSPAPRQRRSSICSKSAKDGRRNSLAPPAPLSLPSPWSGTVHRYSTVRHLPHIQQHPGIHGRILGLPLAQGAKGPVAHLHRLVQRLAEECDFREGAHELAGGRVPHEGQDSWRLHLLLNFPSRYGPVGGSK